MITIWLGWLLAAGAPAGYRVAGVVVNVTSHQPVSGARVTIAPVEHPDLRLAFVTGSDGRFVFLGIPQGRYELLGQRRGLLPQSCDPRANLARSIVTGPGKPTGSIVFALCSPGAISGKVADDAGEPVEHALVELLDSRIVDGRRRVSTLAVKRTTDTGEFRFSSLPAGAYYLAVSGSPWYTKFAQTHGDDAPRSMTHVGYAIQYHSNVNDPAAAEPLILKAGQEVTANFTMLTVPAAGVHVHVDGGEGLSKRFTLTTAGLSGNRVVMREGTESGDLFNFWGVPPGHYILFAQASDAEHARYARQEIDVGDTDTDVSTTLLEAPSLTGMLEVEGSGSLPAKLSIVLVDLESGGRLPLQIGADGKFSMPAIPPQRVRLALAGEDEYYLKKWSVEGARREGETLDLREGSAVRLKVLAAGGAGRVNGTVDHDGHPIPGALVVLAPTAGEARAEDFRAVASASDGSYEFRGVPPGAYALFAVDGGADLEYANPTVVQRYLGSARKIRVAPGAVITQLLAGSR